MVPPNLGGHTSLAPSQHELNVLENLFGPAETVKSVDSARRCQFGATTVIPGQDEDAEESERDEDEAAAGLIDRGGSTSSASARGSTTGGPHGSPCFTPVMPVHSLHSAGEEAVPLPFVPLESPRRATIDVVPPVPVPMGRGPSTTQLLEDVEVLMQRHQREVRECLDSWLRIQQGLVPEPLGRPPPLSQAMSSPPGVPQITSAQSSPSNAESFTPNCTPFVTVSVPEINAPGKVKRKTDYMETQSNGTRKSTKNPRKKRKARAEECIFSNNREELISKQTRLQRITTSRAYEWGSGVLILLNAAFIGWETQWRAEHSRDIANRGLELDNETPVFLLVCQWTFCILFCVELGLRWMAEGLTGFFSTTESSWNSFDAIIVGISLIDQFLELLGDSGEQSMTSSVSILRTMRIVRIVRVVRVIRVLRFFRELRIMVVSVLGSFKSLMWVSLVLLMLFFIFGISFTVGTLTQLDTTEKFLAPEHEDLLNMFGTLDRSIITLFMAMSGGDDWGRYYEALEPLPAHYRLLFVIFITFSIFAVVNIVTGVFVQSALEQNLTDREVIVSEEMEKKNQLLSELKQVFEEMDEDGTEGISREEFERKLDDDRVVAYFSALKLDVSDAQTLFTLLDFDQSGEIQIREFLEGCMKFQGVSSSLDMAIMRHEIRFLKEMVIRLYERVAAPGLPGQQSSMNSALP